ncbi:STAS domain-containing protein [Actinoplanes sp. L3-i22]|uniref:STAS domain-containing protein n=1 Tax=Actinoplanes sp. L3-i22 TaxID=2836373 RepID=UPI001C7989AE|nr:STAS domain-containing protein [Actinoplanes sp. L3-i22]BCY11243.1 hypothetical protein L3i22_063310 [Actinoplanes sp. L3-i22]
MEHDHALRIGAPVAVDGRTVRIDLDGELDTPNTAAFVTAFHQILADTAAPLIELGASHLTFLDSAGVQALVECKKAASVAGRDVLVRDPVPIVHQVLAITELLGDFGLE